MAEITVRHPFSSFQSMTILSIPSIVDHLVFSICYQILFQIMVFTKAIIIPFRMAWILSLCFFHYGRHLFPSKTSMSQSLEPMNLFPQKGIKIADGINQVIS